MASFKALRLYYILNKITEKIICRLVFTFKTFLPCSYFPAWRNKIHLTKAVKNIFPQHLCTTGVKNDYSYNLFDFDITQQGQTEKTVLR